MTTIFWTWAEPPSGHAAESVANIIPVIKKSASGSVASPGTVADSVCNEIVSRGLTGDTVALFLQDFGHGDAGGTTTPALMTHDTDAIADTGKALYRYTGFFAAGIVECGTWVDGFITQYQVRQAANPAIPDPYRVIMDTEQTPSAHRSFSQVGGMGEVIDDMIADGRWSSETLPALGLTWAAHRTASGSPAWDNTKSLDNAANQDFTNWYQGTMHLVMDGAMDESLYQRMRTAFPRCKCCNYRYSSSYDGVSSRLKFFRFPHSWYEWYTVAAPPADFSSDSMYEDKGPLGFHQEAEVSTGNSSFSAANWDQSSKLLTEKDAFVSYNYHVGDKVVFTGGTGITRTWPCVIASKNSDSSLVLAHSPASGGADLNNDDIAGSITIVSEDLNAATKRVFKTLIDYQAASFAGPDLMPWLLFPRFRYRIAEGISDGYGDYDVPADQISQHVSDAIDAGATEFMMWIHPLWSSAAAWDDFVAIVQAVPDPPTGGGTTGGTDPGWRYRVRAVVDVHWTNPGERIAFNVVEGEIERMGQPPRDRLAPSSGAVWDNPSESAAFPETPSDTTGVVRDRTIYPSG